MNDLELIEERQQLYKKHRELLKKELNNILEGPFGKKNLFDEMDIIESRIIEINKLLGK